MRVCLCACTSICVGGGGRRWEEVGGGSLNFIIPSCKHTHTHTRENVQKVLNTVRAEREEEIVGQRVISQLHSEM